MEKKSLSGGRQPSQTFGALMDLAAASEPQSLHLTGFLVYCRTLAVDLKGLVYEAHTLVVFENAEVLEHLGAVSSSNTSYDHLALVFERDVLS